jgi:hypothetical protein
LPALKPTVALADRWSSKDDQARESVRQGQRLLLDDRITALEKELKTAKKQYDSLKAERDDFHQRLVAIHEALPYKVINKLLKID